jgi:uncharacterized protein with gpF-like domain
MSDRFPEPSLAKEFLKKKINVKTDRWDELKWGEHAHAFTVAHSIEADVLDKIHKSFNKAIAEGEGFSTFKKNILEVMKSEGWYGGAGHKAGEKRYINWRTHIMYDTNMKTAYNAEHYRKQLEVAELRPIWVYHSLLVGKSRRQEHIALHNKAFKYDDPFWDSCYPPNGFGCECSVTSESVSGAERDGIEVLSSDKDGKLPVVEDKDGKPINWEKFADPEWKYNVGREALAPNFNKYTNFPKETLKQICRNYHKDMNNTRLTEGEFTTLMKRIREPGYKTLNVMYQIGNLEEKRFQALQKQGVRDSKIMATDFDLWQGKVPEQLFDKLYRLLQEPETIFEQKDIKSTQERILHFVKETKDGKKIKVIVHVRTLENGQTAMQIQAMGYANYDYTGKNYVEIKWK